METTPRVVEQIKGLSQGNISARSILKLLIEEGGFIDPDSELGGVTYIYLLEKLEIQGFEISILYHQVCSENLVNMMALLLAYQLNVAGIHQFRLRHAVRNLESCQEQYGIFDFEKIIGAVQQKHPNFNKKGLGEET